jgi:hypothetical protein
MKLHGVAKRDKRGGFSPQPFSGDGAFCVVDFHCVWIFEPPTNKRATQVHPVVTDSLFVDWCWDWLGDVPLLAIIRHNPHNGERNTCELNTILGVQLTEILRGCYCQRTGRGNSVVEQSIRNLTVSQMNWQGPKGVPHPNTGSERLNQLEVA